ncbi:DUF1338 domain-containing protein [Carboxylicivirga mesophila]|uniref:2-oxoadipate dioxygenase/decarboxylase n=1 Tax=Carboxylicivirga mesophila TaxID=1166478 RepID=A0ABS5K7P0_9BACT|nr:DUF1338 domain-containing protein [Carboxylicivirga mesophila]MBS2210986.1 DUF1338 domain-containing protein [Carboxylicivirga mesophila]
MDTLNKILDGLMTRYQQRVSDVSTIMHALIDKGIISQLSDIENDHIAFRTIGVPQLGIQSLEKIFLHHGYVAREDFYFEYKKINARWYAPPENSLPRIFISELRVNDFPDSIQKVITSFTDEVKTDPVEYLDLNNARQVDEFLHSPLWRTPSWEEFQMLAEVSEYASWAIYNKYYLNHFTISVHNLPHPYNSLEVFNEFLMSIGITLNNAGGLIKTSKDGLLKQSSSVSKMMDATFANDDMHQIAGSYVEFAERKVLPEFAHMPEHEIERTHRRDGFETANADKIFESTYSSQTGKPKS